MSDWPQLEERLLESARQRARRRRALRARRLLPLVAALAVAVIATLVAMDRVPRERTTIPPDEHSVTPAQTPASDDPPASAAGPLERDYGVFRQPPSRDDALPGGARQRRQWTRDCDSPRSLMCLRPETARLVLHDGSVRFYLLQGRDRDDLCAFGFVGGKGAGIGCTTADAKRLAKPMGSYGPPRNGHPASGYTVFPDGVQRVAYTFTDGTTAVRKVQRNFAYITADQAITSLAWVVDGRRYVQTVADVDPADRAATASCPKLDALPADPELAATQTAISTAATLAGIPDTDVTLRRIRLATANDFDDFRRQACGDALAQRSLVAELAYKGRPDGELLLGFRHGAAIVWAQLR